MQVQIAGAGFETPSSAKCREYVFLVGMGHFPLGRCPPWLQWTPEVASCYCRHNSPPRYGAIDDALSNKPVREITVELRWRGTLSVYSPITVSIMGSPMRLRSCSNGLFRSWCPT